jgi:hypothetical protein
MQSFFLSFFLSFNWSQGNTCSEANTMILKLLLKQSAVVRWSGQTSRSGNIPSADMKQKALIPATYEGVSKSFRIESIMKYMLTTINTRWEATQRVMAPKLTRLSHKIAKQLLLEAESCIICSSPSRRPAQKLLDTPSYSHHNFAIWNATNNAKNIAQDLFKRKTDRNALYKYRNRES